MIVVGFNPVRPARNATPSIAGGVPPAAHKTKWTDESRFFLFYALLEKGTRSLCRVAPPAGGSEVASPSRAAPAIALAKAGHTLKNNRQFFVGCFLFTDLLLYLFHKIINHKSMLDQLASYKKFDKHFVGDSISSLPRQIAHVISELDKIKIPASYSDITHIVVNGMGGSNLGANIIKTVFAKELHVPMTITPGYHVPGFVDHKTLYILSSYSGSTEEVLSVYQDVKKKGAKIIAISAKEDNKLQRLIAKDKIPAYLFEPTENPSNQPRLGVGYSIFGMVALIAATGVINVKPKDLKQIITDLEVSDKPLTPASKTSKNIAKKIAMEFFGRMPIICGAEHLVGNMMTFRNQLCENSKNFAQYLILPDMNHFAMEGLAHPKSNVKNLVFLFLESDLYSPRLTRRIELTKAVVKKNGIKTISHKLIAKTKIGQAFEMLQLGEWITYYLALVNGVNPVEIKWVDWFKKELEKTA